MGILQPAARNKLKDAVFGLPAQRKYPMPDQSHAGDAKARAAQMLSAGKITQAEYDQIVAKANKVEAK
jgi:hypothetical protein